jgi:hypothetical protein
MLTPPRRAFFEIPPFLADRLRDRYPWSISPAGVDRALDQATALRGPVQPTPPSSPMMMTPAPGGPPVSTAPPAGTQNAPRSAPPPARRP